MSAQKVLRLEISRRAGQTKVSVLDANRNLRESIRFDGTTQPKTPQVLYAAMLKRQAREIMGCVTECESVNVSAQMARLRDVEELIRFAINHDYIPANECGRSDKQLIYAATVGDVLECIIITKKTHRAPTCVSQRDEDLTRIERKLDLIAGAIVRDPQILEALFGEAHV